MDIFFTLISMMSCFIWPLFMIFGLVMSVFWLAGIVGWILMLIDAIQRDEKKYPSENEKIIWIIVLVLAGWIGALLYYFMIYKKLGKA